LQAWPQLTLGPLLNPSGPTSPRRVTRQAVIINADVLPGPGMEGVCCFNPSNARTLPIDEQEAAATAFLSISSLALPNAVLSPGWTTKGEGLAYSTADIDSMLRVCARVRAPDPIFTFPVRATYVQPSWLELRRLLAALSTATLTVWSNVALSDGAWEWLQCHLDPTRTLYDVKGR
jgi:hypothetical protein